MSDVSPDTPSRPDFLFIITSTSFAVSPSWFIRNGMMAGSMSPQRVPIIRPSSGVRPMLVSMHLPSLTAEMEPPLPMWQVMILVPTGLTPRYSHTRCDT